MTKSALRFLMACAVVVVTAQPAAAQFRFGIRGGVALNDMHFDKSVVGSENRAGFTGGVVVELSLPVVGLGVDAAAMYVHRNSTIVGQYDNYKRDYVEIPVHLHYKLGIVGLGRIVKPYAFAGPNFAFLAHESRQDLWENRSTVTALDLGFGVELLNHIQVSATYSTALNRSLKQVGIDSHGESVDARDRTWMLTAAYLF